jgi:hypothetical protein
MILRDHFPLRAIALDPHRFVIKLRSAGLRIGVEYRECSEPSRHQGSDPGPAQVVWRRAPRTIGPVAYGEARSTM